MKNRVRRLAAFLAALVAGVLLMATTATAAGTGWYTDYEEAVAAAKREGKPIFADFSTTWCGNCRLLEQQTFPHPVVSTRLDNFVKLHIDAEQRADVAQRYNVQAYPTLVMLDPSGRMVTQEVGFVKPQQLAGTLDRAMQMLAPTLAQAQEQLRAEAPPNALAEGVELHPFDAGEIDNAVRANSPGKPAFAQNKLLGQENSQSVAKAPPVNREAPQLATLEAPKLPSRGNRVNTLLRGKLLGEGSTSSQPPRLIAQATNSRSKATEEVEELPRPLLGPGAQDLPEPPSNKKDPELANDSENAEPPSRKGSSDKQAAAAEKNEPKKETSKSTAKEDSGSTKRKDPLATIRKLQSPGKKDASTKAASGKTDKKQEPAAAKEVTASDINRWIKEADSSLISQQKKKARAMYQHVVEKDPENKFGKSDMAFIKMVSLMVDEDDDALRRMAYNKIKEFEARFPDSEHKDYYTLIRATLAADLGETNSAHKLLENYTERFPDSKYQKLAYDTWKSLPPVKKETASNSSRNSSPDDTSKSSGSGGKKKSTTASSATKRSGSSR